MRFPAVCGLIVAGMFALDARTGAQAAWCAQYRNGGTNCGFSSFQQCLESVRGVGGQCGSDGSEGSAERSRPLNDRREAKPKREPEKKPVAAVSRNKSEPRRDTAEPAIPPAQVPVAGPASQSHQAVKAFAAARVLILTEKYEAGIAAMRALGYDDQPDVAASIGFANAKLGRLDEARLWYEKALGADPNHVSALASYGMLRVQLGDAIKARDDLERLKALCGGTGCREYQDLAGAIAAQAR